MLLQGSGSRALCAGGDVAAVAELAKTGLDGQRKASEYFRHEYVLDHTIATYTKPFVSIMNGITSKLLCDLHL